MRRPPIAIALLAIALAAGACAASQPPGWTYAPPTEAPPVTPAPSVVASATPAEPTPVPGSPTASPGAGGDVVQISALGVVFEQKAVSAPADVPFVIHFNNKDASTQHNVEIRDAAGMSIFKGQIFAGVAEKDYQVQALAAGTYQFVCTVHPNMVGTLTVGG